MSVTRRVRVAYFSPMPPSRSGIADYSALLLSALRRRIDVRVARRRLPLLRRTDVALYHVGNDPDVHGWIVKALRRRRGLVVLHDFVLHHLVAGMTLARGDAVAYAAAMERDSGAEGLALARQVASGTAVPPWETRADEFPLVHEVLDHADGVVVHSRYVAERVREEGFEGRVWRIPMPVWPAPPVAAASLGGSPVFGTFGHVNPSKRLPQLLEAFARLLDHRPGARLVIAGAVAPSSPLEARVEELGLGDAVVRTGYVDEPRLWSLMAGCDAVVALRFPTMGETSAAALRALALGRPLVVSDVGWFAELPRDVAIRIPLGDGETDALAAALDALASDVELRQAMRRAALEYVRTEHDLERVAEQYASALEWTAGGEAVTDRSLGEIAQAAADVGLSPDSTEVGEVVGALRETGIAW